MKRILFLVFFFGLIGKQLHAQGCCSGGSGSPMVGGVSMGVLQNRQFDIGESFQYFSSSKFFAGSKDTFSGNVSSLKTSYLYSRIGYGISQKLTLYVEAGYFLNKTETGYDKERPDYKKNSSGIADLIIFPRYDVYDKTDDKTHTEVTLGLGIKLPLGNYHDSTTVYVDAVSGQKLKTVSPPTVQTTTGSNDFIFYGFVFREYKKKKFRVFANGTYIRKGYNGMGEKFGDYASMGLFVSKTFLRKLGLTVQLKYEWIDRMAVDPNIDYQAKGISIDPYSTGSKKISLVPQMSYPYKSFNFFALYDLPLYQYLNGMQIGSQYMVTAGFSYRFMPTKFIWKTAK